MGLQWCSGLWGFGGVVVRPLAFHLKGSEFDPQYGGLEPSPHVKRVKSTLCRKSWVFSGYSGFLPQGKLTGWDRYYGPTVIGSRCCGDPALVAKLNKKYIYIYIIMIKVKIH